MPSIEFIPIANGMTPQEIIARLDGGWIHIGDIAVRQEAKIVDPTKPMLPNGVIPCHVWVQQEPLVPAHALVDAFYEMALTGLTAEGMGVLSALSQRVLGLPIAELVQTVQASAAEAEGGS